MRTLLLLFFGAHLAIAVRHSMTYITTSVSGIDDMPEYTTVATVDDIPFVYYDSKIKRMIAKTEWIRNNVGTDYWDRESQRESGGVPVFMNNIEIAKQRFNQTAGVHTFQQMYGCEFEDETGATDALRQFGYDGEDLLSLDLKEMRWVSPVQQGIITTEKLNKDRALLENDKQYFTTICIEWLKKYLQYGKNSLMKKVSPQVSLLQKDSFSPVICHATGFFPSGITISWKKNEQDHDEDVDLGELLPNEDGTYQKTSTLKVTPDELKKNQYRCVVEHQGRTITENEIRTNGNSVSIGIIIGVGIAVALLAVIGVAAYIIYQKKKGFKPVSGSDDGSNSSAPNA